MKETRKLREIYDKWNIPIPRESLKEIEILQQK